MTHDPYKLCADVTCPHCGVKGRLVSEQETRLYSDCGDDDFELLTCVECGGLHESHGFSGDEHLKAMRIQFGRLIEGRPYEPPKPKEWEFEPIVNTIDLSAYDALLKDIYGPGKVTGLEAFGMPAHLFKTSSPGMYVPPAPPADVEMETVDVNRETGVITFRYVKK